MGMRVPRQEAGHQRRHDDVGVVLASVAERDAGVAVIDSGVDPKMVSFTGHSLGGILAGYMAGITGAQANFIWCGRNVTSCGKK